jgi:hypothetical protein
MERLNDNAEFVTCTSSKNADTNMVGYTECSGSSNDFESNMNTKSGVFTAPSNGRYQVTFTGLLKSYGGNRVWVTLYKIMEGKEGKAHIRCNNFYSYLCKSRVPDNPEVAAASFVGMHLERVSRANFGRSSNVDNIEADLAVSERIFFSKLRLKK